MESITQAESPSLATERKNGSAADPALQGLLRQKSLLLVGDLIAILATGIFVSLIEAEPITVGSSRLTALLISIVCYPAALYVFDMYNVERALSQRDVIKRTFLAILLGGPVSILLGAALSGQAAVASTSIHALLLWSLFTACRYAYSTFSQTPLSKKPVLIVGTGDTGQTIYNLLSSPASPYSVKGFLDDAATAAGNRQKIVGAANSVAEVAGDAGAAVILAVPRDRSPMLTRSILTARLQGTMVEEMADVYERLARRVPVAHIRDEWLLSAEGFDILHKAYIRDVKRFLDLWTAGFLLLLASPAILLAALLIHLDSAGPVFYTQERVGKNGKAFRIYKFRSMRVDAEEHGAQWAAGRDARVTRVGRWLRLYRIDELPQLWNVLKGDMSIVGPRPERPEFISLLEQDVPYYSLRHYVKPGITGWAQVTFRYGASTEDALTKLEADVYYIKNMSLLLDLKILLKTIGVVFLAQGSR